MKLITVGICWILWGFFAHQKINRHAVFSLPPEMFRFYKRNINYISEHAVDPDKRRYVDTAEGAKHYIDLDNYEPDPKINLPTSWSSAAALYTEDALKQNGIVPWQIQRTYYALVKAFLSRDSTLILKHSSDLGHYVSDAHVPLHTTRNYNGQLSGQHGIHGFWESRIPELFASDYNYYFGSAVPLNDPLTSAWEIVYHAYSLKDTVLAIEKQLSKAFPEGRRYEVSERKGIVQRQYSLEYSDAYHRQLNGMVEQQMRSSIFLTACYWYSAWIEAGQPLLEKFPVKGTDTTEVKSRKLLELLFKKGRILGREESG